MEARAVDFGHGRIKRAAGLVEEVYSLIRADIMSLRIPPDTRISVDNLVRELGVSQTPIREALSMLEGIGLVTKKHFVGYCTAPKMTRKQFTELHEMRLLMEPYVARRAAEKMSEAVLDQLIAVARHREPADTYESYTRFVEQDSDFHSMLAASAGNALIVDALARLHIHMNLFRVRYQAQIAAEAVDEHIAVLEAIQRRDPDAAEAAMLAHITRSYDRLVPFTSDEAAAVS